ncbi:flippase [Arenimonas caeni]|uniref:Uncharacterized protein n=1 Tax=Arenimonas caeni TaxID=2058085 RepID=A0A2P6MBN2_9GAMM|nr:flippase [Arenimonas caeni]PRH83408.1 hypothetical protein C6N40_01800 [Arenimonas caeni]
MCASFVVGIQLARGLGPASYGIYGTAMAVVAVLMIPTELGLPQLVTREVAGTGRLGARAILSWALKRIVISSLLIVAVAGSAVMLLSEKIDPALRFALVAGFFWIPFVAIGNVFGATLRGLHWVVRGQLGEILVRPALMSASLLFVSMLLAWQLTPQVAMGLNVVSAISAAVLGYIWLKAALRADVPMGSRATIPPTLTFRQSMPIALTEGMRVLAGQIGVLILAFTAPDKAVGEYRVAIQVYAVLSMPSTLVNIGLAPMISALHSQGEKEKTQRLNDWISVFLVASSLAVFLAILLLGERFIHLSFGDGYEIVYELLSILLLGEIIISLFGHPIVYLNMVREQRAVMRRSALALGINAAIIACFAPVYGALGAIYGTLAGMLLWRVSCAWYARRALGVSTSLVMRIVPPKCRAG